MPGATCVIAKGRVYCGPAGRQPAARPRSSASRRESRAVIAAEWTVALGFLFDRRAQCALVWLRPCHTEDDAHAMDLAVIDQCQSHLARCDRRRHGRAIELHA